MSAKMKRRLYQMMAWTWLLLSDMCRADPKPGTSQPLATITTTSVELDSNAGSTTWTTATTTEDVVEAWPVSPVLVEVRREQRHNSTMSQPTVADDRLPTERHLANHLHRARIRRKHYRLLTILKHVNDRIGRGASSSDVSMTSSSNELSRGGATEKAASPRCSRHDVYSMTSLSEASRSRRRRHRRRLRDANNDCDGERSDDVSDTRVMTSTCSETRQWLDVRGRRDRARATHQMSSRDKTSEHGAYNLSLWLKFSGPLSSDCESRHGDNTNSRLLRTNLVLYVHAGDVPSTVREIDNGLLRRQPDTSRDRRTVTSAVRTHGKQQKTTINFLLVSVYQQRGSSKRRQPKKLRVVGQQRISGSFVGWTTMRLRRLARQSSADCARRGASQQTSSSSLLVHVTDLVSGQSVPPRSVIKLPPNCSQPDEDEGDDERTERKKTRRRDSRRSNATRRRRPYIEQRLGRQRHFRATRRRIAYKTTTWSSLAMDSHN